MDDKTLEATELWDRRFLEMARGTAKWSKDPSTKVGCVVVNEHRVIITTGYNGFPRGVADDSRLEDRDEKYPLIVHAEENAVAAAARIGARLQGCTLYATLCPCTRCARLLIQAGVQNVVAPKLWPGRWDVDISRGLALFAEAGVSVRLR